jgi:hypothetical protein
LTSKLRVGLGFGISIVAAAAISAFVTSKWSLFAPKDYEECAQSAAKDARSKDALSVLLSICSSEFKARRKAGGGYAYYDGCRERTFDIKGPNPTPDEQAYMREKCSAYLDAQARVAAEEAEAERRAQQAAQIARTEKAEAEREAQQAAQVARAKMRPRELSAMKGIEVELVTFEANNVLVPTMRIKTTNRSNETISNFSFAYQYIPKRDNLTCPTSLSSTAGTRYVLRPGESAILEVEIHRLFSFSSYGLCARLADIKIEAD